jgi:hypothetical protein
MTRLTVRSLIVEDLGYCCPTFFFQTYRKTALVAARLGVTERAIRYAKAAVDDGQCSCEGRETCMRKKITLEGSLRKRQT